MKTTQDNSDTIIKDKINSLDSLPEGYTPSLDSKWELLMAGMQPVEPKIVAVEEKKEKKNLFYLYAAAACFLAIFTFGWLFLGDDKFAGNQIAVVTEKPVETSAAMPEKMAVTDQKSEPETVTTKTSATQQIAQPAVAKKQVITTKNNQVFVASAKQKISSGNVITKPETTTESSTQTEHITSAQPEQLLAQAASEKLGKSKASARKKAKIIELNFEAEKTIATPAQHDPQVAQQNLKFKFFPRTEGNNVAQHESVLKVKHTF